MLHTHYFDEGVQSNSSVTELNRLEPLPSTSGVSREISIQLEQSSTNSAEERSEDANVKRRKVTTEAKVKLKSKSKGKRKREHPIKDTLDKRGKLHSTCNKDSSVKGKGKQLKQCVSRDKYDDASEACGICGKFEKEDENWICCDACNIWYHKDCVGLDEDDFDYFLNLDAVYICPLC
ncbi:uncharacterized protein LOC123565320 [Mercenaria mercenaria]|uniref:uncharacterized protein LOC123565320 n=1 Tax=Mercenaria mercenaria TaxID=6596 RepID=UPI001E1D7821|nr:uncharacterized protein LOC123565320 [Mercenaria mercenaria]